MQYTSNLKLFVLYNVSSLKENAKGLYNLIPLGCTLPILLDRELNARAAYLIFIIATLIIFTMFQLRVPKTLYICPVDAEYRYRYVRQGFWLRFCVSFLINVLISVILFALGEVSGACVLIELLLQSITIIAINYSSIVQFNANTIYGNEMQRRRYNTERMQVLDLADSFLLAFIYVIGLIIIMTAGLESFDFSFGNVCSYLYIIISSIILISFHRRKYNELVHYAASYEYYYTVERNITEKAGRD